jgi:hypothetical protein
MAREELERFIVDSEANSGGDGNRKSQRFDLAVAPERYIS